MKKLTPFITVLVMALPLAGQVGQRGNRLITRPVDPWQRHRLTGNTRPEAIAANDAGAAPADFLLDHMLLQLQRSAEQERALQQRLRDLQDPKSPNYHKWLSATDFAREFAPAQSDVDAITGWLKSEGFTVHGVYPSGMVIDFSGTAAQVANAFQTEIHFLDVNGELHLANMSDPQIPAALAPAVSGVVSMHDFKPRAMRRPQAKYTYTQGTTTQRAITPGDLAAIYNLNPLFSAGITGKGQTIAVIEDADLYDTADFDTFRSTFGLSQYSGTLTTVHPAANGIGSNCLSPGTRSGDDGESTLDAEWAAASAPDATIQLTSCANSRATSGLFIALQNTVNQANPPSIISLSYGQCEGANGASANAAFRAAYQQAVAEGISVFVSAGDEGAAACDSGASGATHGIAISGLASTPYNVAVGGTDFGDVMTKTAANYWSATNSDTWVSALGYIPEIPWNDSCGSSLLAGYLGFTSPYGSDGLCSSTQARNLSLLQVAAGGGGPSGCATGFPDASGVSGGTCTGYSKPVWQTGFAGVPDDGVRDIPDVSLFAGAGVWGHFYVVCYSNPRSGSPCTGDPKDWYGAGGTSFSAPVMAGIQALVNQKTGSAQGNPNPMYYKLAASGTCDSSAGDDAGNCVFHNVTKGDIAVNCNGSANCFGATSSGRRALANGALSVTLDAFAPAFAAGPGWNFATGLGSVNATALVNAWQ